MSRFDLQSDPSAGGFPPYEFEGVDPMGLRFEADDMSPEWHASWTEFVRRAVQLRAAVIDGACRAAYLTGTHGVLVEGNTVTVTTRVPFGEVRYVDAPVDVRDPANCPGTVPGTDASEPPCRT